MSTTETKKSSKLHKVMSVIGLVLCVIFAFLLICNITIIVKGTLNPDTPPKVFGVAPMVVLTGSMSGDASDHIEPGDLIFVKDCDVDDLEVGDVITYMPDKSRTAVTHRIIEVKTDDNGVRCYTTKGDANNTQDKLPVYDSQIVGIYWFRIAYVGEFALFLQEPLGLALFVGIPVMAFIIFDVVRRQKATNRETKRNDELEAELERLRALAGETVPEAQPAEEAAEEPAAETET